MTNTEPNPIELVRERLDGGRKWHKGARQQGESVCIVGAVLAVEDDENRRIDLIYPLITAAVVEQYRDRLDAESLLSNLRTGIPDFNDHPLTEWHDVDLVLDKASVAWDEQVR